MWIKFWGKYEVNLWKELTISKNSLAYAQDGERICN